MAHDHIVSDHAAPLAHVMDALSTRTLNHFAEEARQNGESLKDAFERYEIDYAWHVLGSDRLREATLAHLASRQHVVTAAQKDSLAGIPATRPGRIEAHDRERKSGDLGRPSSA